MESLKAAAPTKDIAFDFYVVLDFEATCSDDKDGIARHEQELIKLPSVLVDARTLLVVDEFQRYIRPVINPKLTRFCTSLTGITQNTVNSGVGIVDALQDHQRWLESHQLGIAGRSFAFVTWGDWDLKSMLPRQLKQPHCSKKISLPRDYMRWINIKQALKMRDSVSGGNQRKYRGQVGDMEDMLSNLGLEPQGRHRSGIDNCRNIARILISMIQNGARMDVTAYQIEGVVGRVWMGENSENSENSNSSSGVTFQADARAGSGTGAGVSTVASSAPPLCLSPEMVEYTAETLAALSAMSLHPETSAVGAAGSAIEASCVLFWGHDEGRSGWKACLSNWYPARFQCEAPSLDSPADSPADGNGRGRCRRLSFHNSEQYMMWRKALLFGDHAVAEQVLRLVDGPKCAPRAKRLGRAVRGFSEGVWRAHALAVVSRACYLKFGQNPTLRARLLGTGDKVLVEASPHDAIWGIGLSAQQALTCSPSDWPGANLLGECLMRTRTCLRGEDEADATVAGAAAAAVDAANTTSGKGNGNGRQQSGRTRGKGRRKDTERKARRVQGSGW